MSEIKEKKAKEECAVMYPEYHLAHNKGKLKERPKAVVEIRVTNSLLQAHDLHRHTVIHYPSPPPLIYQPCPPTNLHG